MIIVTQLSPNGFGWKAKFGNEGTPLYGVASSYAEAQRQAKLALDYLVGARPQQPKFAHLFK